MALLNEEDENNPNKLLQPTQPVAQQAPSIVPQSGIKPAIAPKDPQRKGTGFTNLNRIMQANQGNKLGSSVAGGVTGRVQGLQTNIQQSQQKFGQQAQAGRLDTPEAEAHRASVLGRFDQKNFTPDESKFQVSSGLQEQYGGQKTELQGQQTAQKTESDRQRALIQSRIDTDLAERASGPVLQSTNVKGLTSFAAKKKADQIAAANKAAIRAEKASRGILDQSVASLQNLLGAQQGVSSAQEADIADKLANIESQYGIMSAAEKDKFISDERDKMMVAQLPTNEEAESFRKYQTGTYTGPQELEDYQTLLGKAQQTEDLGTLSRSTGGRQELLKQFVGGKDYTQGQRGLDEAILGQDKSSLLARAAKKALGSEQNVMQQNKLAGAQAQGFTSKAKQFGEETRKMIGDKREKFSGDVDKQMEGLRTGEAARQTGFKSLQDILTGTDPKYTGMDKTTRTGIALQTAMDQGFLSPQEAEQLVGQNGLVQRSGALGLDTNALLSERMKNLAAVGIDRRGAASAGQESTISALDKLMGKTGTDVEFGTGQEQYQAGKTSFDVNNLRDYLAKTEAERGSSPEYIEKLKQAGLTPMQQTMSGVGGILGTGTSDSAMAGAFAPGLVAGGVGAAYGGLAGAGAAGMGAYGAAAAPVALAGMLGYDALTGGDSTAKAAESGVQTTSGLAGMQLQGKDAVLKALLGNKLVGNSAAGQQLQKLMDYQSQIEKQGLGELTKEGMNAAGGFRDLTQTGRLDQAIMKLSGYDTGINVAKNVGKEAGKAVSNVSKAVGTALGGGKTGGWGTHEYNTNDATTGQKVKIGTYAGKSSGDILKQMMSEGQLGRTASKGKGGAEGAKAMNALFGYYQDALKREKANAPIKLPKGEKLL